MLEMRFRALGVRVAFIVGFACVVLLMQMLAVSRLSSSQTKALWKDTEVLGTPHSLSLPQSVSVAIRKFMTAQCSVSIAAMLSRYFDYGAALILCLFTYIVVEAFTCTCIYVCSTKRPTHYGVYRYCNSVVHMLVCIGSLLMSCCQIAPLLCS